MFAGLWLLGAWALSAPFPKHKSERLSPLLPNFMRIHGQYERIRYRVIEKTLSGKADARSIYVRSEFFLLYSASFKPDKVLNEWFTSARWRDQRRAYRNYRQQTLMHSLKALNRGRLYQVYEDRKAPPERPLALSYPQLPDQFTVFVVRGISASQQGANVPPGFYRCKVVAWRAEDSYAESIEMCDMEENIVHSDQATLLNAIRHRKAAVESVLYLNMPIFIFTGKLRKLPRLKRGQRLAGKLAVRSGSVRDYGILDQRLLKIFGGVNPANLIRLSWFYHPNHGIKPDEPKYQRLIKRADDLGAYTPGQ